MKFRLIQINGDRFCIQRKKFFGWNTIDYWFSKERALECFDEIVKSYKETGRYDKRLIKEIEC